MDIVGFGLINKDCVAVVPAWERDQKVEATRYFEQVGGPVPVALQAAARLGGVACAFLGVCGDDHEGGEVAQWLDMTGVQPQLTRAPGVASSKSLVFLDARDGSRTLANYAERLPPMTFGPEQEALLRTAHLLHLDGRDLNGALHAARIVRDAGGEVSLDLGTMRPGREALLRRCDIVLASKKGGAGAFPEVADDPEAQTQRFLALGAKIAGVTLAEKGAVIGTPGRIVRLPAFTVDQVVDTCGAGDTFHGAFLWAHRSGYDPFEAAGFAQAAVAQRIQRYGNRDGLPTLSEVEEALRVS